MPFKPLTHDEIHAQIKDSFVRLFKSMDGELGPEWSVSSNGDGTFTIPNDGFRRCVRMIGGGGGQSQDSGWIDLNTVMGKFDDDELIKGLNNGPLSYDEYEGEDHKKKAISDRERMEREDAETKRRQGGCYHHMVPYTGLNQSFKFCTKCDYKEYPAK